MDPKLALLVQLWPIFSSWRWSQSKTGLQFKLKRLSNWTCSESKSKKRSMLKMFCWRHFIPLVTPRNFFWQESLFVFITNLQALLVPNIPNIVETPMEALPLLVIYLSNQGCPWFCSKHVLFYTECTILILGSFLTNHWY